MSQIWKRRARKPTATGKIEIGYYPSGVGGVLLNIPCIELDIGDHRVIIPVVEFADTLRSLKRIEPETFSVIIKTATGS